MIGHSLIDSLDTPHIDSDHLYSSAPPRHTSASMYARTESPPPRHSHQDPFASGPSSLFRHEHRLRDAHFRPTLDDSFSSGPFQATQYPHTASFNTSRPRQGSLAHVSMSHYADASNLYPTAVDVFGQSQPTQHIQPLSESVSFDFDPSSSRSIGQSAANQQPFHPFSGLSNNHGLGGGLMNRAFSSNVPLGASGALQHQPSQHPGLHQLPHQHQTIQSAVKQQRSMSVAGHLNINPIHPSSQQASQNGMNGNHVTPPIDRLTQQSYSGVQNNNMSIAAQSGASTSVPPAPILTTEEISTIFVVGFPDDMQEREFQNMFTFSHGFEAATLKIPNKDSSFNPQNGMTNGPANPGALRSGGGFMNNNFGPPNQPPHSYTGATDPYNLVTVNSGGVVLDSRDLPGGPATTAGWPGLAEDPFITRSLANLSSTNSGPISSSTPVDLSGNPPNLAPRKQIIGFAKFTSRQEALIARDMLQGKRVDVEKGAVLKAEMAKKNLHTKRGVGPLGGSLGLPMTGAGVGGIGPESLAGLAAAGLNAFPSTSNGPLSAGGAPSSVGGAPSSIGSLGNGPSPPTEILTQQERNSAALDAMGFGSGPKTRSEIERERENEEKMRVADYQAGLAIHLPFKSSTTIGALVATPSIPIPGSAKSATPDHPEDDHDHEDHASRSFDPDSTFTQDDVTHDHEDVPSSSASAASFITSLSNIPRSTGALTDPSVADDEDEHPPPVTPTATSNGTSLVTPSPQKESPSSSDWPPLVVKANVYPDGDRHSLDASGSSTFGLQHFTQLQAQMHRTPSHTSGSPESYSSLSSGRAGSVGLEGSTFSARMREEREKDGPIWRTGSSMLHHERDQSSSPDPTFSNGQQSLQRPPGLFPRSESPRLESPSPPDEGVVDTGSGLAGLSLNMTHQGMTSPQLPSPSSGGSSRTNVADQNPPINTLYVGNLPTTTPASSTNIVLEENLRAAFARCEGYRKLCFRQKSNGPMCFVEFEDVAHATKALNDMYGSTLNGLIKGGIRLSFSKNPLGVRTPSISNGSGNGFAFGNFHEGNRFGSRQSSPFAFDGPPRGRQDSITERPLMSAGFGFDNGRPRHGSIAGDYVSSPDHPSPFANYASSPPSRFFSPPPSQSNAFSPIISPSNSVSPTFGMSSSFAYSGSTFSPFGSEPSAQSMAFADAVNDHSRYGSDRQLHERVDHHSLYNTPPGLDGTHH